MLKILTIHGSARSELEANSPKTHAFLAHTLPLKKTSFPEVTVCVLVLFVEETHVHLVPSILECRGQMFLKVNEDHGIFVLEIWA